jgi:hypothetical protein
MRLPRDLSGQDLVKALRKLGYQTTRQTSSHIRLTRVSITSPSRITTRYGLVRSANYLLTSGATTS